MILMIDNYDSFTHNLVQYCGELDQDVIVARNDQISLDDIAKLTPDQIIISPGPCTPKEAGVSVNAIKRFGGEIPILGVCLGHQSIADAFGGVVTHAREIMHGKTSPIHHQNTDVFVELENPFTATRYHSLIVQKDTLPDCLEITAWTQHKDGSFDEIMGMRHKELPIYGVQFHPESILTNAGHQLLQNFFTLSERAVA